MEKVSCQDTMSHFFRWVSSRETLCLWTYQEEKGVDLCLFIYINDQNITIVPDEYKQLLLSVKLIKINEEINSIESIFCRILLIPRAYNLGKSLANIYIYNKTIKKRPRNENPQCCRGLNSGQGGG